MDKYQIETPRFATEVADISDAVLKSLSEVDLDINTIQLDDLAALYAASVAEMDDAVASGDNEQIESAIIFQAGILTLLHSKVRFQTTEGSYRIMEIN